MTRECRGVWRWSSKGSSRAHCLVLTVRKIVAAIANATNASTLTSIVLLSLQFANPPSSDVRTCDTGVKGFRARLLYKAGLKTPEAVASCNVDKLTEILIAGEQPGPARGALGQTCQDGCRLLQGLLTAWLIRGSRREHTASFQADCASIAIKHRLCRPAWQDRAAAAQCGAACGTAHPSGVGVRVWRCVW